MRLKAEKSCCDDDVDDTNGDDTILNGTNDGDSNDDDANVDDANNSSSILTVSKRPLSLIFYQKKKF